MEFGIFDWPEGLDDLLFGDNGSTHDPQCVDGLRNLHYGDR